MDYISMDYISMDYISMDYISMDYISMDYMSMDYISMDYISMDYISRDYICMNYISMDYNIVLPSESVRRNEYQHFRHRYPIFNLSRIHGANRLLGTIPRKAWWRVHEITHVRKTLLEISSKMVCILYWFLWYICLNILQVITLICKY
jgi:hypothetical protein